jgi:hypothetical protein
MSIWTHVTGIARVDSFRILEDELDFSQIFEKELEFEDSNFDDAINNPDKYLPFGSEGSLKMTVWDNPDKFQMAAYTVSIFGDLRDYDEPEKIIEWFKNKCSKLLVRDAVITARSSNSEPIT